MSEFGDLLEKHANIYPGQNTKIDYTFFSDTLYNDEPNVDLKFKIYLYVKLYTKIFMEHHVGINLVSLA